MQSHHKVVVTPEETLVKWKCEVCTYENWPASIRCAMCQSTNCNKVRTENHNNRSKAVATSSSTDIFKMGATSLSRSTSPQVRFKWFCQWQLFLVTLKFQSKFVQKRPKYAFSQHKYLNCWRLWNCRILTIINLSVAKFGKFNSRKLDFWCSLEMTS